MPAKVIVLNMRGKYEGPPALIINTCSNSPTDWQNDLSPFKLGPCHMYGDLVAKNMENAWQYAKVYQSHTIPGTNEPAESYHQWAKAGWDNPRAVRYPMGRGAKPLYSLWDGKKLGYVDARKQIYAPLYLRAVRHTIGFQILKERYETNDILVLRDFDGYDHDKMKMSLTEVLNNPKRKMGHAFVLKMMLTGDAALEQFRAGRQYLHGGPVADYDGSPLT